MKVNAGKLMLLRAFAGLDLFGQWPDNTVANVIWDGHVRFF
jgi:hypothetical protein